MVSIPCMKRLFEQFDTQGFDLVYMLGPGKPAVHRADVPLGSADADLRGEERANRWAGGRFWRKQIEALPAAPRLVAPHSRQYRFLHLLRRVAGIQDGSGLCKDVGVMRFDWLRRLVDVLHRMNSSHQKAGRVTVSTLPITAHIYQDTTERR